MSGEAIFCAFISAPFVLLITHMFAWALGCSMANRWKEHEAIAHGAGTYKVDGEGTEFEWLEFVRLPTSERTPSHGQ